MLLNNKDFKMLQLTPEETAFAADFAASLANVNAELQEFSNSGYVSYRASEEERAEHAREEVRVVALRDAHNAKAKEPIAIRIGLKTQFNSFIAEKLPGGETSALVSVANDILTALTTDESVIGTGRLLKTLVVMGVDAVNDPELHAARARGTFARYTALIATGLPEDFVRQIMIAEAARAIPMPSLPSVSSSRR